MSSRSARPLATGFFQKCLEIASQPAEANPSARSSGDESTTTAGGIGPIIFMPTGSENSLSQSGRYDGKMDGALQLLSPNNTGKTTLINTLQFLSTWTTGGISDFGFRIRPSRHGDFYSPTDTVTFYSNASVLPGQCVFGWRGIGRKPAVGTRSPLSLSRGIQFGRFCG